MTTYKIIKRKYLDNRNTLKEGLFIAEGMWSNNHLAYSRLDENGHTIENEECVYIQIRENNSLLMIRI